MTVKVKNNIVYIDDKAVGRINNGYYITDRIPSKHFHVLTRGYPISESILNFLYNHDVFKILIVEKGVKKIRFWKATVLGYRQGDYVHHPPYDEQLSKPLDTLTEMTIEQVKEEEIELKLDL